jgi:hypothetical protein
MSARNSVHRKANGLKLINLPSRRLYAEDEERPGVILGDKDDLGDA